MSAEKIKNLEAQLENLIKTERENQESERFDTLLDLYNTFMSMSGNSESKSSVYLNEDILSIVIKAYFDDIYRYKLHSHTERADNHKQGAYIIKWLSKLRPIQILPDKQVTKELLFINSAFAIFVGFSFLKCNAYDVIEPFFYKHLLGETQYRNISGKNYASILYQIEKLSEKKKII
jgi:hypothetical protein